MSPSRRSTLIVVSAATLAVLTAVQVHAFRSPPALPEPAPQPHRAVVVAAPAVVEPASRVIELRPEVQGRLRAVHKHSGDPVARGEVLAELEDDLERAAAALRRAELERAQAVLARLEAGARAEVRDRVRAELAQAEAAQALARIERDRARALVERRISPGHALDAAEADLQVADARAAAARAALAEVLAGERPEVVAEARAEVARATASLALAEAQVEQRRIRSPLDGVCVYRFREPGEVVGQPNDAVPVLSVASLGRLHLRADVDAIDIAAVHVGQDVVATSVSYPGRELRGRVVRVEQTLGRKNFRTDRPRERVDTKILEVVVELEDGVSLPLGLEVTATFAAISH